MRPQDLTYQAFKLYNNIKAKSYKAIVPSEAWSRLYFLQNRAFYRYIRRVKLEAKFEQVFFNRGY
jgi:hypothetical protein